MTEIPRIITADCSAPREIDDGLFVEKIHGRHEMYQVGVCIADTSKLYMNSDILGQAQARTTARYWDLPNGERGYDPMVPTDAIRDYELTAGTVRDALIVRFKIGPRRPPRDLQIDFGKVEVTDNLTYKEFAQLASEGKDQKYTKVSDCIKRHLGYVAYGDHEGTRPAWSSDVDNEPAVPNVSAQAWKRGSKLNEAYMVAANHLVGQLFAAEGRPAIYRVHDPDNEQLLEVLSASAAHFSWNPGPHAGLNLDPYCRVTSPLRRLDDFVMNFMLKQRFSGQRVTARHVKDVRFAVRRLNQEIVAAAPKDLGRLSKRDILGKSALSQIVRGDLMDGDDLEVVPATA